LKYSNSHIIQRQSIEINFENPGKAAGLQNQVAELFYEKLQPRMEVLLDELFGENQFASIAKLEIDCGQLDIKNWEQEFTEIVIRKLKEELTQVNKKELDLNKPEQTIAEQTFFYFLENGFLPWNKRVDSIAELEQLLTVNEKLIGQLKNRMLQKTKIAQRLAFQFSPEFKSKIIAELTKNRSQYPDSLYAILEKINAFTIGEFSFNKNVVDEAILVAFSSDENNNRGLQFFSYLLGKGEINAQMKSGIKEILEQLRFREKISDELQQQKAASMGNDEKDRYKDLMTDEAIYIANAGLVLLHPFLTTLFEHLKITKENDWLSRDLQQSAVLVLEFLATGNDQSEEFDLVLNKILCGFDITEVVSPDLKPGGETKTECENLLTDVITHWKVLKNTSIDGLREAFLQRNGKLSRVDNGWLLQVKQKAMDVLLSNLPWGIGLIKLPWMDEMLYVEWT